MNLYELKNITHVYNGRPVLNIDHWRIADRCIVGLCGPNGSGKSTLLKLLAFTQSPTKGTIFFKGQPAAPFDRHVRTRVALLTQDSYLFKRTVYANVAYGLRIRKQRSNENERVRQALDWVGLSPSSFAQRPWFALSGGEAHRVSLAARLVLQPEVLLLDEPTTSVDTASAQLIKEAVLHAHNQWGTALIIASHDMPWLQEICDRTLHLFNGRLMGSGHTTMVFGPFQMRADGLVVKTLAPGQDFIAAASQEVNGNSAAFLDADEMKLYHHPEKNGLSGEHRLQGTMMRLSFDKPSGRISADVSVGSTTLTLLVDPGQLSGGLCAPGSTVWVGYDPRQIRWQI